MEKTKYGGVLRQRDFRLLWFGETARTLGNSVTAVALPLIAVVVLDADATAVGLLSAAVWLPWLVVGLPAGAWMDRVRRRPVMLACNVVSAVLYASVPVLAWLDALTFTHLLVVALAGGTTAVFFNTANHVYLPTVLAERDLLEGNSKLRASEAGTSVAGPGLAGVVAHVFGAVAGLLVDALTFLVSAVCLSSIHAQETPPKDDDRGGSLHRQIAEGLRFVLKDRYLRPMVIYGAVVNLALMGYQAVQVVFLVRTVGISSGAVGLVLTAGSLGGIVGAMLAASIGRRFGTARGMLVMQLLTGPWALLMPLTSDGAGLLFFAAGAFVIGVGIVSCNVVLGSFRQMYCPPQLLGRVVATTMMLNHSTIPIGSLLGGFLGDALSPRAAMWITTGLLAPCWLILALGPMRAQRDLPTSYRPADAAGDAASMADFPDKDRT
ncbi:MFS transporter [Streptomyces sp. ISL-1]|uniref:MFS transporter n=1 Tax=Streptomyces sp. ISL-1 TaxID=2817657 RepID=UPI001BEB7484|nr:MFS transporter [Streptomyces sp. ISL-1]MBT2393901.1 MFS transporter [Streptomyces sp. ISL-1]